MSRTIRIDGPASVRGRVAAPGDKSISHRVAMLASIARGTSTISGFATSADCADTLECLRTLGIRIEQDGAELRIHGNGLLGYCPQADPVQLYAGNSGSTIRMLSGILAAQPFESRIDGDEGLRRRPMRRIMDPLRAMGASLEAREGNLPPLAIKGGRLRAIKYDGKIASAQIKTCMLFAGLHAEGTTRVSEPLASRNHTELMLEPFGASVVIQDRAVSVTGGKELSPITYTVPGDFSSAVFLISAASMLPDSEVTIPGVGLNPTRSAFLDVLRDLGGQIRIANPTSSNKEDAGDLIVSAAGLTTGSGKMVLNGGLIPNLIDEIPMLAVLATRVSGRTEVRDAGELRIKESDRIRTVVDGIRMLGGKIEEFDDGFAVTGPQSLVGAAIDSAGDHRIAMAFSIAGLIATGTTRILGAESASVSFPEFYDLLQSVAVSASGDPVVSWEQGV